MPLFDLENPDTGDVITVEHPQAPTQEEALALFANLSTSPQPIDTSGVPAEFRKQITQEQNKSSLQRALGQLISPFKTAYGLVEAPVSAVGGGLGATEQGIENILQQPGVSAKAQEALRFGGNQSQSVLQGIGNIGYDVLNAGTQGAEQNRKDALENPLQNIFFKSLGPLGSVIQAALPKKQLTEADIQKAFEDAQAQKVMQQGRGQVFPDIFGTANPDVSEAVTQVAPFLGVPEEAVAGAGNLFKKVGAVGQRAPEAIAADVLRPTGQAAEREFADLVRSGNLQKGLQEIKATKAPTDLPSLVGSGNKTLFDFGQQIDKFKAENKNVVIPAGDAAQQMRDLVNNNLTLQERNPSGVAKVLDNANKIDKDLPLNEAFQRLTELNDLRDDFYKKTNRGQATDLDNLQNQADDILRRDLSQRIDAVVRSKTGIDDNFFRKYGIVKDITSQAEQRLDKLFVDHLKATGKPLGTQLFEIAKDIGTLQFTRAGKEAANILSRKELGAANKQVKTLFNRLGEPNLPQALTPDEQAILMNRAGARDVVPSVPGAELNNALRQIQELNQTPFAPSPAQVAETGDLEAKLKEFLAGYQPYP